MANPPLTDLAGFAGEHLHYEAAMFVTARDILSKLDRGTPNAAFSQNLLVEACVLHFRNLVDFFYLPPNGKPDDVTAVDYIPEWGSPAIPPAVNTLRDRVNKELAHLTTARRPGAAAGKEWDFAQISLAMKPIIDEFVRRVDAAKVTPATIAALKWVGGGLLVTGGPVFNSSTF